MKSIYVKIIIFLVVIGLGIMAAAYYLGYEKGKIAIVNLIPALFASPTPSITATLSPMTTTSSEIDIPEIGQLLPNFNDPFQEIRDKIPDFDNSLEEKVPTDLEKVLLQEAAEWQSSCKGRKINTNDYQYTSDAIDLNNDRDKEFIITPIRICGDPGIRGATGNGSFYIFQRINNNWRGIGDGMQGNFYSIKNKKTDGYYDIITYWQMSAGSGTTIYYRWDKLALSYEKIFSKDIDFDK